MLEVGGPFLNKFNFPLNINYIDLLNILQKISYLSFELFNLYKNKDKFRERINKELSLWITRQYIRNGLFVFDETLWKPRFPEIYDKLGRVYIQPFASIDQYCLEYDFRKTVFDGVSIINENGQYLIDIMNGCKFIKGE